MVDKWFLDKIWDEFEKLSKQSESNFWKQFLDICSRLLKWEIDIFTNRARKEEEALLQELWDSALDRNNQIDGTLSELEKQIINTMKGIDRDDKDIENWLEYIEDLVEENKTKEMEILVEMLQKISDSDNNWESDLKLDEFEKLSKSLKRKKEICEVILKGDNDVPENLKTKKEIIDSYNNVIENNEWKTDSEIIELIIENLKWKQQVE